MKKSLFFFLALLSVLFLSCGKNEKKINITEVNNTDSVYFEDTFNIKINSFVDLIDYQPDTNNIPINKHNYDVKLIISKL